MYCQIFRDSSYVALKVYVRTSPDQANLEETVNRHLSGLSTSHPGCFNIRQSLDNFYLHRANGFRHYCIVHEPLHTTMSQFQRLHVTARPLPEVLSCNTCFKALTSSILKLQSPIAVRSSVPSGSSSSLIPSQISSSRTLCCKLWTPVCSRLSKKKRGQRPPFAKSSIPKERFINLESSNIPRGMPLACQCFATLVRLESAPDFPTKRYNPKSTERPR